MSKQLFTKLRIRSKTRPRDLTGMIEVAVNETNPLTKEQIEKLSAIGLDFFIDSSSMVLRGEGRYQEKFVLQGGCGRKWVNIKPIVPHRGK